MFHRCSQRARYLPANERRMLSPLFRSAILWSRTTCSRSLRRQQPSGLRDVQVEMLLPAAAAQPTACSSPTRPDAGRAKGAAGTTRRTHGKADREKTRLKSEHDALNVKSIYARSASGIARHSPRCGSASCGSELQAPFDRWKSWRRVPILIGVRKARTRAFLACHRKRANAARNAWWARQDWTCN